MFVVEVFSLGLLLENVASEPKMFGGFISGLSFVSSNEPRDLFWAEGLLVSVSAVDAAVLAGCGPVMSDAAVWESLSLVVMSVSRLSGDSCLPSLLTGFRLPISPPSGGEGEEDEEGEGGAGPFSPSISSKLCRLCSQWNDSRLYSP